MNNGVQMMGSLMYPTSRPCPPINLTSLAHLKIILSHHKAQNIHVKHDGIKKYCSNDIVLNNHKQKWNVTNPIPHELKIDVGGWW